MSNATERLGTMRTWEVSIGHGAQKAQVLFCGGGQGVADSEGLQKPEDGGGTKAVKGRDWSRSQHSCSTEAQEDCFLF